MELREKNKDILCCNVYEALRDASSYENARAIQDSESITAIEQKKMIQTLIHKGWSKNEIIYEMQRIFGNDILINTKYVDYDKSFHYKWL